MNDQRLGFWLGIIAVTSFGLTLPMTRIALPFFDALFIGFGRAALAGLIAAVILLIARSPLPSKSQIIPLVVVVSGVVFGFPLLSAMAMETVPAAHGGVILGVLPLATACVGTLINQERPSALFWVFSVLGATAVVIYSLGGTACVQNTGCANTEAFTISLGHGLLFLSVIAAAVGYAVGGKVSSNMQAWRVICWSLVLGLPITLSASVLTMPADFSLVSTQAWGAFLYLSLISQLFGFFIWYKGLAMGGIARVSQTQLLQPFVTLGAAAQLLNEVIDLRTLLYAVAVVLIVWVGRNARIETIKTVKAQTAVLKKQQHSSFQTTNPIMSTPIPDLTIRPASINDTATIHQFVVDLAIYEKAEHEVKATEQHIVNTLFCENAQAFALIAQMGSTPVGFAVYFYSYSTWLGKHGIYLEDLYVTPESRGNGAGKALLQELAKIAVAKNCGRVEWSVLDWNDPSIQFYKSLGAEAKDGWTVYRLEGDTLTGFAESQGLADSGVRYRSNPNRFKADSVSGIKINA